MPQKQNAKRIFFSKPVANPVGKRDADLAFDNPVKKFAADENELGKTNTFGYSVGKNNFI